MGGKDTPDPPDYRGAAEEQAQASAEITNMQTYANRPNQNTPFGSQNWDTESVIDPATGQRVTRWTQNTELNPMAQAALEDQQYITRGRSDLAKGLLDRARDEYGPMVNWDNFQDLRNAPEVPDYQSPEYSSFGGQGLSSRAGLPGTSNYDRSQLMPFGNNVNPEQLQRGLDFSDAPEIGDPRDLRGRAEDAVYQSATSRLDPQFEQRAEALESQLRNQGLRPGDEAYDTAMQNFERQRTDAYQQANFAAINAGRDEAAQLFGQDVTRRGVDTSEAMQQGSFANQAGLNQFGMNVGAAGLQDSRRGQQAGEVLGFNQARFGEGANLAQLSDARRASEFGEGTALADHQNKVREQQFADQLRGGAQSFAQGIQGVGIDNTIRQQQITEEMQRRGFTLNEINAILTGQQVGMPTMPSFSQATKSETPQYMRAAESQFGAELDSFNAEQQALQGMMSGVGSMAGGFMPMCDGRLKKNLRKIGTWLGINIYTWEWNELAVKLGLNWLPRVGPVVQELPEELQHQLPNGLMAWNPEEVQWKLT
jgi:hypothetical protein